MQMYVYVEDSILGMAHCILQFIRLYILYVMEITWIIIKKETWNFAHDAVILSNFVQALYVIKPGWWNFFFDGENDEILHFHAFELPTGLRVEFLRSCVATTCAIESAFLLVEGLQR